MTAPLSVLIVEDSEDDTLLAVHELQKADYAVTYERVETEQAMGDALTRKKWDVVLSDYTMPLFNGLDALRLLKSHHSEIPFIFVSGTIGEDRAVIAMKAGASDYVLKGNLKRLVPAVARELKKTPATSTQPENAERFQKAFEQAGIGMALASTNGQFLQINTLLKQILGLTETEASQTNELALTHPDDHAKEQRLLTQLLAGELPAFQIEKRYCLKQGRIIWALINVSLVKNAPADMPYFIFQIQDITARKLTETQLKNSARNDTVTGLIKYASLEENITQAIKTAAQHDQHVAILLLEIKQFKTIADTLTLTDSNKFLQTIAERLRTHMRSNDIITRTANSEFIIALTDIAHKENIKKVAKKVLTIFHEPFIIGENAQVITANIGISIYPDHGRDYRTLVQNAEAALNKAEHSGENNYQLATATIKAETKNKLEIENLLRAGLANGNLLLYFQPQINLGSGRMTGAVAQVRLQYSNNTLVPTVELMTVAEETGLIIPLEEWLLHAACMQLKQWNEELKKTLSISIAISLSAQQLQKIHLADKLKHALEIIGLAPQYLELIINENILTYDLESGIVEINRLKQMGIKITVDNFSMNYFSLNYLKHFNLDKIKIDRAFIRNLPTHLNDIAITNALITIARTLDIKVLADGVETKEQLNFLIEHQCDEAQGSYFGKPVLAEELAKQIVKERQWLI